MAAAPTAEELPPPPRPADDDDAAPPACYLIVHNVSKKANIGTLARCATAFGVAEVLLVGERSFNTFGAHGADAHVAFRHFPDLTEVRSYLVQRGARILGVEITPSAVSVATLPFCGATAFMLGNEGSGLSAAQCAVCDGFVFIPQHGPGTASLNVAVAAGIVLHRFAEWAGYSERARDAAQPGKFDVAPKPHRTAPRGCVPQDADEVRARRAAARAEAAAAAAGDAAEADAEADA